MTIQTTYDLSINQVADAIAATGNKNTLLVQGHMGCGKSTILKMLGDKFPNHTCCYVDCTTKDLGDLTIPNIAKLDDGTGFVEYLTNEELGLHIKGPVIIMVDEYGKANPAVKNALTRLMLEHKMGSVTLHEDSMVFATTNLAGEGVGDLLMDHQKNRLTIVRMRKPTPDEWVTYGLNAGVDPSVLRFVKEYPQVMQSYEEVTTPQDNQYIFHPKDKRPSFATPRSLEAASNILKQRASMDDQTLTAMLMGTIGVRTALDMMAFVHLADQLPSLQSIKDSPLTAIVPDSAAAVCMVVYRTLSVVERDWVDAWMTYLPRLSNEAQGLFANGVRTPGYGKQALVMTNAKFTKWAMDNNFLFASDKK